MDWETTPVTFVGSIVVAALVGAAAAGIKEINGESFQWRRFVCRTFYRTVLTFAGGLIISTWTSDLRLLWSATMLVAVAPVGEKQMISWLPFNVHQTETKDSRTRD